MTLREALEAIHARHGKLTPELVIAEAEANRSLAGKSLHARYEWDNNVAGKRYRLAQAAEDIRSVRVVYREATEDEEARSVRAWHVVRKPDGNSYEPLSAVAEDPLTLAMVLRDAEREWKALHRRYAHLSEWAAIVRADLDEAA